MKGTLSALVGVAILAAFGAPARAAAIVVLAPPALTVQLSSGANTWAPTVTGATWTTADALPDAAHPENDPNAEFTYQGTATVGGGAAILTWHVNIDTDPFVRALFTIENTTATAQTYTLDTALPVPAIAGGTRYGGSTGVTLNDSDGTGTALLTSVDAFTPIYAGQIDTVTKLGLFNNFSLSTDSNASQSFSSGLLAGQPTIVNAGGVISSIGIHNEFTLSPGDTAGFTNFFRVEAIPEPVGLAGFAVAGGWAMLKRRRC